ncbi:hypothetical protein C7475_101777 [Chitinophaga sp. S165]|nr:hypothetical protein C7475_101777 [Chitinophaga sp. S165]
MNGKAKQSNKVIFFHYNLVNPMLMKNIFYLDLLSFTVGCCSGNCGVSEELFCYRGFNYYKGIVIKI